jgi:hypothetical protein
MEAHLVEDLDELRLAGKSSARRNGRVDLEVLLAVEELGLDVSSAQRS